MWGGVSTVQVRVEYQRFRCRVEYQRYRCRVEYQRYRCRVEYHDTGVGLSINGTGVGWSINGTGVGVEYQWYSILYRAVYSILLMYLLHVSYVLHSRHATNT